MLPKELRQRKESFWFFFFFIQVGFSVVRYNLQYIHNMYKQYACETMGGYRQDCGAQAYVFDFCFDQTLVSCPFPPLLSLSPARARALMFFPCNLLSGSTSTINSNKSAWYASPVFVHLVQAW